MRRNLICLLLILTGFLSATIRYVDIDGTGQYTSIQAGINAAVNSDTVLVYPGIYLENVDYAGKSITIASLELTTGNPAYRDSTIIDGHNNGSCVKAQGSTLNCVLYGFTLQNGSGHQYGSWIRGGGICIYDINQFYISNCIVKNNTAYWGGGLYNYRTDTILRNCQIYSNIAGSGGGIYFYGGSLITFDSQQRCSVYENYAGGGNDIHGMDTGSIINVILNTATVLNPSNFYMSYVKSQTSAIGGITYDIQQGYREEVNADLYVSTTGNDLNNGLTPDEPLKTISWALHKIASDSLNPKTVYVLPGTYSTDEGQIFPLALKSHVNLIGDYTNRPNLINNTYFAIFHGSRMNNIEIANFNVTSISDYQYSVVGFGSCIDAVFSNVKIINVNISRDFGSYYGADNLTLRNIDVENSTAYYIAGFAGTIGKGRMENCSFNNCHSTYNNPEFSGQMIIDTAVRDSLYLSNVSVTNCSSSAMTVQIMNWEYQNPVLNINNLLIANNTTTYPVSALFMSKDTFSNLSNCTFANNTAASHGVELIGKWNVSNCIFDNDTPTEIFVPQSSSYTAIANFKNNLIKNYPNSVTATSPLSLHYLQGNFGADPVFSGTDVTNPLSYQLGSLSPCIDAGTQDTTGLYLPAFDLLGNPRIYNNRIDIGCFEWDGTPNQEQHLPVSTSCLSIGIFPNPLRGAGTICVNLPHKGKARVEIYNIKGQRIREYDIGEKPAGFHTVFWDGMDTNYRQVSTGTYLLKLIQGTQTVTRKIILFK